MGSAPVAAGEQVDKASEQRLSREARRSIDNENREDPEDILDVALPHLFDIAPIAFSTPTSDSYHTYTPPSTSFVGPITLKLPRPSAEVYTKLQANHLWLASIYLADTLALGQIPINGLRIAELGAAAGLPGIVACKAGATVISSDWGDEGIISVLNDNFKRNCEIDGRKGHWAVKPHEWGTNPSNLLETLAKEGQQQEKFDLLFLSDTLWVTEAHQALLDSVFNLLRPGGTAHVVAGLHTGRGPLERFVAAAKVRGAVVKMEKEVRWKSDGGWSEHESSSEGLEEERGVVVHFTLTIPA